MPGTQPVMIVGLPHGKDEWTSSQSTDGDIKTEESGKTMYISEVTLVETGGVNPIQVQVKKGDGGGTVIYDITIGPSGSAHIQFGSWRIGDAYDAAGAGDLYLDITGTGTLSAFWIGGKLPW